MRARGREGGRENESGEREAERMRAERGREGGRENESGERERGRPRE